MKVAVRYYSRSGNTKALAEEIAKAAGVEAVSVDAANAQINEPVDLLFVGGALYAYGLDSHLKAYLKGLNSKNVKKAAVFSTSWISKHSIDLMKKMLEEKEISVVEKTLYAKNRPDETKLAEARSFAAELTK